MKKKIALIHKFNQGSIEFIKSMNGIPNPSLAFIPTDTSFEDYGDCTLIADAKSISFSDNVACSIDIYSPTTPDIKYELNESVWVDLNEQCQDAAKSFGLESNSDIDAINLSVPSDSVLAGNQRARESLKYTLGMMLLYLKHNDLPLPVGIKQTSYSAPYGAVSESIARSALSKGIFNMEPDEANVALTEHVVNELNDALSSLPPLDSIRDRTQKRSVQRSKAMMNNFIESRTYEDDGVRKLYLASFSAIKSAALEISAENKKVDLFTLRSELEQFICSSVSDANYDDWVKGKIKDGFGEPWFYRSDKNAQGDDFESIYGLSKEKATLKNISDEMNSVENVVGAHAFSSVIKVAASVSERFNNYHEVEDSIDRFISGEDYDNAKKSKESDLIKIILELAPYSRFQQAVNTDQLSYITSTIERFAESKMRMDESMNDSFYVGNVPDSILSKIDKIRRDLSDFKFPYFEMKSSRPMALSDFEAVIVPRTITKSNLDILLQSGLKVIAYDQTKQNDWLKCLNSNQSLLIGDGGDFKLEKHQDKEPSLVM
ncbi:hypothetical protein LMH73_018805 [Vibrio splendidus]|nr:hypothetical protein [Vibrio splendidus]MCC4880758.1 hypothetical protein [Vibrio splendidus]